MCLFSLVFVDVYICQKHVGVFVYFVVTVVVSNACLISSLDKSFFLYFRI